MNLAGEARAPTGEVGNQASPWASPAGRPELRADEVHVWKASVAEWTRHELELLAVLDATEIARAGRFHFLRDRLQFIVAHGLVRRVLGRYAICPPERLQFGAGAAGKPRIIEPGSSALLQYNLSHSADVVLIAVMQRSAVGVDVERWSDDVDPVPLSEHFFSPAEGAELRSLPASKQQAGFFACWSRKEAYIKATGLGVTRGLDYFDVTVAADRPAELRADRLAPATIASWQMVDLDVGPRHAAALMMDIAADPPNCFSLRPNSGIDLRPGAG